VEYKNYTLNLDVMIVTLFALTCVGFTTQPAATLKFGVVPGFDDKAGNKDASGNSNTRALL